MHRTDETTTPPHAHGPGPRTDRPTGTGGAPTPAMLGARLARIHSEAEKPEVSGDEVEEPASPALS